MSLNNTLDNLSFSDSKWLNQNKFITSHFTQEKRLLGTQDLLETSISVNDLVFITDLTLNNEKDISYEEERNKNNKSQSINDNRNKPTLSQPFLSNNYELNQWGLTEQILYKYKNHGIVSMFPWQYECLNNSNVLKDSHNLIYSAPTSAGKTLVAEILAIKTVLDRNKKVLFILPFVSVVREKMFYFQDILGSSGIRVEGFMGSYNPPGGFQAVQVAICTIEKANGIINRLMEDCALSDIGAVIVDEMHLLGDSHRGYLLELMLTKLQYMKNKHDNIHIQIIGMSATLPNLALLGKWLKAELYVTDFRPVCLYEQCLIGKEVYSKDLKLERKLLNLSELETDSDNILQLCLETIQDSCSVLIFCPTKNWCENLAQQIAVAFWKLGCTDGNYGEILRKELNSELISETLEQLKQSPVGLDAILCKTISFGTAFHHAGLSMEERDIIESAFRNSVIRVLIATSTLSSGVNLPARRVIIRTPMFHGKLLDVLVYKQMVGRAGRMGKDTCGESILICQKSDYTLAKILLEAELRPIESCLEGSGKLKRAILEVVASSVAVTPEDVKLFTESTLLAASQNDQLLEKRELTSVIDEAVSFLIRNEFIRLQRMEDGKSKYIATPLGKACLSSSMAPEEGLTLFTELEKARQCFVLETELHLVYLVTPYNVCNQWGNLDWMLFLQLWEKLPSSMKKVGELVGVRESFIIGGTRNKIQTGASNLYGRLEIHKRFFTALALQDLVNEIPLNDVALKFGCTRGMLQSLQQSASTFAGMLTTFSRQLGWSSVEILISQFQDRLHFGVNRDLLDLMRLPILNGPRARTLYNAGIKTVAELASSDVYTVENVLRKVVPFETEKEREGETKFDSNKRNKIKSVWITGKEGLTEWEAAEMLVKDARRYLELELGLVKAKWEEKKEAKHINNYTIQQINNNSLNLGKTIMSTSLNSSTTNTQYCKYANANNKENNLNVSNSSQVTSENSCYHLEEPEMASECNSSSSKFNNNTVVSDQSLFEESFDVHNQQGGSLNIQEKEESNDNTSSNANSSDSGLDFDSGSFLENIFASSFELEAKTSCNKFNKTLLRNSTSLLNDENNALAGTSKSFNSEIVVDDISTCPKSMCISSHINEHLLKIGHSPKKRRTEASLVASPVISDPQVLISADLTKIDIIDVCGNELLYQTFISELYEQMVISLSVAYKKITRNKSGIGLKILDKDSEEIIGSQLQEISLNEHEVVGISLAWGNMTVAYYVSFQDESLIHNSSKNEMFKTLLSLKSLVIQIFEAKEQIKILKLYFGWDIDCTIEDPKVGDWLIDPGEKEKTLQAMVLKYTPHIFALSELMGNCKGIHNNEINQHNNNELQKKASIEAVITRYLCQTVTGALGKVDVKLLNVLKTEMKIILILSKMELNGFGVNLTELQLLADNLKLNAEKVQKQAYTLAGRKFSFISSKDVAKVLGIYKGQKLSTGKHFLEQQNNPIATSIMLWRKLNSTLTKMIYPLIQSIKNGRIHGICVTHNSTGRISMHDPNLQNVPNDFEVKCHFSDLINVISCRKAFVPEVKNVFLSADYCQLELRILSHFSQDPLLCEIMKSGEDVFLSIAAKWKNIKEIEVDSKLRQWAKQICYGIIYGMGNKTLAEHLSISDDDASEFIESFHARYQNIKKFIETTISKCKLLGYVETIAGRRRYLPYISHVNMVIKSQAERQAVNTTVQGSAADIAKLAMVTIDERFRNKFRHSKNIPRLVLHLHDELLYEVQTKYLYKTAAILKKSMEDVIKLSVPLPVKMKSGFSWGTMNELKL